MGRDGPIDWQPYLWERPRPARPEDIDRVEAELGVRFPEDYRAVLLAHQGEVPRPELFDFEENCRTTTTVMGPLFHVLEGADTTAASYNIVESYRLRQDSLPPGIVPFSEDPGGNPIAFDFRRSAEAPTVVFVNHEAVGEAEYIWPVAGSFTEFLGLMHEE